MIDLGSLVAKIVVDSGDSKTQLQSFGDSAENTGNKFEGVMGKIKTLVAGLAIGAVLKKGFDIAKQAVTEFADKGDDIDKMSQKFSMSAESYQQWESIAGHNGTTIATIGKAIKEITVSATDNAGAYEAIGISMKNTDDTMRDSQSIFQDTILALSDMEAGTERDAKAKELLGGKYQELLPLINGGRDSILEQIEASKSAVVMTDEQVKSAAAFKDAQQAMQEQIDKVKMALTEKLVPALVKIMDWISEHMPEIQKTVDSVVSVIGGLIEGLSAMISALVTSAQTEGTFFNEVWKGIQIVFETVFKAIQDIFAIFTAAFNGDWEALWEGVKQLISDIWDGIKALVQNNLKALINILDGMRQAFKNAATALFNKIKDGFTEVWNKIKAWVTDSFNNMVDDIKGFGTELYNAGTSIITSLWDGMKDIWESISSWLSDKVEEVANALTFWSDSQDEMSGDNSDGSHRTGLSTVPFDGYKAVLHKGEMVLTQPEADRYKNGSEGAETNFTVNQNFYGTTSNSARQQQKELKRTFRNLGIEGV